MADTRNRILTLLAPGNIVSGGRLAEACGVSREAVWKHIESLRSRGVSVEAVRSRGYRIQGGLCLLNRQAIGKHLLKPVTLTLLEEVASTNSWLLRRLGYSMLAPHVCISEQQSAGRGTKGRAWLSPYGTNVYCSLYWRFECAPYELEGLSPAIAIALVNALGQAGVKGVMIKWPNDLHMAGGKLGGLLVDISAEANGPCDVIIGFGLNMGMPDTLRSMIDQPVADILDIEGMDSDRNAMAACVINGLTGGCEDFAAHGFAYFSQQWEALDLARYRPVRLMIAGRSIVGIAHGVNERGMLRIRTNNRFEEFASGEVSMGIENETVN